MGVVKMLKNYPLMKVKDKIKKPIPHRFQT
jgi:hypothetical protein